MATFAISTLTRHWDTGAQLILSPSWWMDDPDTPTWARTNQAMARIEVLITDTETFGVVFGTDCYKGAVAANIRIAPFAIRVFEEGAEPPDWTYGVRPTSGSFEFLSGLNSALTYRVQLETTCVTDATSGIIPAFEVMRQAEDVAVTTAGTFVEITDLVADIGATFLTVDRTGEGDLLKVLIIGDSISSGFVDGDVTAPSTIPVYHPISPVITIEAILFSGVGSDTVYAANFDVRGSMVCVHRRLLEEYSSKNNKRLVILNASYPGAWQGELNATLRSLYVDGIGGALPATPGTLARDIPGLYADVIDRLTYRTNESSTDWADAGDWTGGFSPDVVMIGTFSNDCLQARFEPLAGGNSFISPTYRDAMFDRTDSLMETIRTTWPDSKQVVIYGPKDGSATTPSVGAGPVVITIQSDVIVGMSSHPTYFDAGNEDARSIAFFSMYDLADETGYPTAIGGQYLIDGVVANADAIAYHPSSMDHAIYAAAWYDRFEDLLSPEYVRSVALIKSGTATNPTRLSLENGDDDNRTNRLVTIRNSSKLGPVTVRGVSSEAAYDWVEIPQNTALTVPIPEGTDKGLDIYTATPAYRSLPSPGQPLREIPLRLEITRG